MSKKNKLVEFFSVGNTFSTQNIVVMGMMLAASVVIDQLTTVFVTPQFKLINFSYIPGALVAMLYGPWAALAYGFVSDLVKFVTKPTGAYFFGYTLSEMVSCFIYACLLYRKPVKVWRFALARLLFIIIVVFGLNFIWSSMMFGTTAGKHYSSARVINQIIQFPLHIAILTILGKYLPKIIKNSNYK